MGARGYAVANLGCATVAVAAFLAVGGLLPLFLGLGGWWTLFLAAFCGIALIWLAASHIPLLIRGGIYRVVVQVGGCGSKRHRAIEPGIKNPTRYFAHGLA